jgi:hypothetical protein
MVVIEEKNDPRNHPKLYFDLSPFSLLPLGEGPGMRARSVETKGGLVISVFSQTQFEIKSRLGPQTLTPTLSQRETELRGNVIRNLND